MTITANPQRFGIGTIAGVSPGRRWLAPGLSIPRPRRRAEVLLACLAVVGAVGAEPGGSARHAVLLAQEPSRLTVRPRERATGTRNAAAGEHPLDSLTDYLVYVPAQAVGARRVPLVVMFGGGGVYPRKVIDTDRELADKYGMILFAPNIQGPGMSAEALRALDAGLEQVLRTYAIDPTKIALAGSSNGGDAALVVGCANLDVFSRIGSLSPVPQRHYPCGDGSRPKDQRTRFFLADGIGEGQTTLAEWFDLAARLREDGHVVQQVLNMRTHQWRVRDHDYMWRWFQESWAQPNPAKRRAPRVVAEPLPKWTSDVLTKMTTFWTWLRDDPGSPGRSGPDMPVKAITIAAGRDHAAINDVQEVPASAAQYQSVAAALKRAGLTPTEEERYRSALIGAEVTREARCERPTLAAFPEVDKNVAFMAAHLDAVKALLDKMEFPRSVIIRSDGFTRVVRWKAGMQVGEPASC